MSRRLLLSTAVTVVVALAGAGVASAGQFRTVYTENLGGKQFAPKPAQIILDSADGGLLKLTWTVWNSTIAVGHGTSNPDHGTYPITVKLSAPNWGTFQRLTVTFHGLRGPGVTSVDPLELANEHDDPTMLQWATASWIKNEGASGLMLYNPDYFNGCAIGNIGPSAVGGLYGISVSTACAVSLSAYNQHALKVCGGGRIGHSVVGSFEGYTTTNEYPQGIFFERGSSYFTLVLGCPGE